MVRRHRRYEDARILLGVSRVVSSSLDLNEVSDLVLKESTKALGADYASLFLMDEVSHRLTLTRAYGFSEDDIDNIKLLGNWELINDRLVKSRRSVIINDVDRDPIFRNRRVSFSKEKMLIKSFLAVPLRKGKEMIGALIVSNRKRIGHLFTKEDEELMLALSNNISIALQNARLYQDLKDLFLSTTKSLVRAIDAKDRYTSGHSERVMAYSMAIGKELRLKEDELENLKLSSLLHDVGKIGIRESILSKRGALSKRERKEIEKHPLIGKRIVETIDDSERIIRGIVEHHEHFDGGGYPNRLKGRSISLHGRIIAIADAYDALTTTRPYQKKYTEKEAVFQILSGSGIHFDPVVVKAFIRSFSDHTEVWKA